MLKIIASNRTNQYTTMGGMKPLQIARIINLRGYEDNYVMRTASVERFEVMNITSPGANKCWENPNTINVELLEPGEAITINLFNDEEDE